MRATPEQQRRLVDLQEIDTAIRQLDHRRSNLPEQKTLDENIDTLERVAGEYANNREELSKLELRQKRLEDEIATVDARRKSEEGRMYSGLITSAKELEALRGELSSLKSRKADLEDELLEVMERREDVEGMVTTLKDRHAELDAEIGPLTRARDDAATDIDAELAQRREDRAGICADLPDDVVNYYEDLLARKDGMAVAGLSGRTCLGCRIELTAMEMEETHRAAQRGLAKCEQCGRILVPAG